MRLVHASPAQSSLETAPARSLNAAMSCHQLPARPHPLPWWTWAGFIDRTRAARSIDAVCITVTKAQPLRHVCPADVRVTCLSGTAWITTEADVCDVVLDTGQAHDAARGARLFINGLPFCELRIAPRHDERQDPPADPR
jgi:hypothetical protein